MAILDTNQLNTKAIQTLQLPFRILTYVIAQVSYHYVKPSNLWSRILNKPC